MAKNIKGITIEIGGNTEPLENALNNINKQTKSTQYELKQVEKLLKLDPTNIELLTQKQQLLNKQTESTKQKLEALRKAEEEVQKQFERGEIGEKQYREFRREIINTENSLKSLENQNEQVAESLKSDFEKLKSSNITLKNELENVNEALQFDSNDIDLLNQKSKILNTTISGLKKEMEEQEKILSNLENEYKQVSREKGNTSDKAKALKLQINNLTNEYNQNKAQLSTTERESKKLNKTLDILRNSAEQTSQGFTVMKGAMSNLVADGIKSVSGGLKDLITETDNASTTFQMMTGTSSDEMAKFNQEIKNIYNSGLGESLTEVSQAMAEIKNQTKNIDTSTLSKLTANALQLQEAFGFDIQESIRAVNMLTTQFGITGEEAFNLIVQGVQNGLNKNNDLLDVINEYSVKFASSGDSAEDFFNRLQNSANAGTFSIDKSADAFKEFTIRITESGEEVTNSLNILGLNADEMANAISKGGEDGYNATQKIIEGLLNIEDPLEQNRLGMQIFGTMWEDAGGKAILAMANTKGEIDLTKNSLEQLSNTNLDSMSNQWQQVGRTLKDELLTPLLNQLLPKIQELVNYLKSNLPEVKNLILVIGTTLGTVFAINSIATFISSISTIVTTIKTLDIVTKIVTATQWLWNAALSANPIGVVVMAIAGLVAGIVLLWNNCEGFRNVVLGLWEVLKVYLTPILKVLEVLFSQVLPQAVDRLKQKWEEFKNFCIQIWDNIKNSISEKVNGIIKFFAQDIPKANQILIQKFIELKDRIIEKIVAIWNSIVQWGKDLLNFATKDIPQFVLTIIEYIAQLPIKIWDYLKQVILKVIEWGENLFKEGKNSSLKLFNSVIDNIKNLPTRIMQIGKDIITGLWNGINEKISWLTGKITEFGTGIINKVKEIFDIHSPSRVFKAIGNYIMQGLGIGIKEGTNYPIEEMERVGQVIINSGNKISTGLISIDKKTGQLIYDNTYTNIMKKLELFQKEKDKRISLLDKGTEATLNAIDKEISATQNAYDVKLKLLEQEHLAKISLIDEESARQIALINEQIEAINRQKEAEKRAEDEERYKKEYEEKKAILDALQSGTEEYIKAKQELDALVRQREKELLEQKREEEKEALRQQIEDIKNKADKEKETLKNSYEEKKWQLEQQKTDELNYLKEIQKHLNTDLELRKELEQVQTEIKAAENEKRTSKEIQELKTREKELIKSLKNNENELKRFSGKVLSVSKEYGQNFLTGFKSTEGDLRNYINDICSYMRSQLDSISSYCDSVKSKVENTRNGASNISLGRARETINSYGSILMNNTQNSKGRIIEKTEEKSNNINVTQHIYNNTQDPRLQQKRAIRELRKQALGV
nr:phage tail tape measure protein [uncultured Tyzzerella sp.]